MIFSIFLFIPIMLLMAAMPYLTRKTESFGVGIPSDVYDSEALQRMRKRYGWQTLALGIVFIIIASFSTKSAFYIVYPITLCAFIVGSFLIYLAYHRKMKALKTESRWTEQMKAVVAVDTRFRHQKMTVSHAWFFIPFAIAVITFVLTFIFYDQFPAKFPMHYDFDGTVTTWADKSYRTLLLFPLLQLFMTGLFLFINVIIAKSKQSLDPTDPKASAYQNITFRYRWSMYSFLSGTMIVLLFAFAQLSFAISMPSAIVMSVPFVVVTFIVCGAFVLSFTTGQGGSRVHSTPEEKSGKMQRDEDRYWKLGQFYFNPNDPAIFVEKRFGIGWTVNFAHPAGWGFLAAIIVVIVLLQIFVS
ncbi:MAG TPA: DUF5808 domain-containing protein [Bacillales bacterium]|nr:DUF5808 domain-containing protein [Bacillales bacterium]